MYTYGMEKNMNREQALQKLRCIPVREADLKTGIATRPTFHINFYLESVMPQKKSTLRVFVPKRRKK
jgi:hypothetical protein